MSKRLQPDSKSDEETGKGSSSQPTDATLASQLDLDPTINPEKRTKPSESPSPNLPAKESNEKTVDAGPQDDAGKPEDKDDDDEDDEDTGKEKERGLLTTLTSETCLVYWRLAVERDMALLSDACRKLTAEDFYKVTASPGLAELPHSIIRVILSDDELRVQYESDVVEVLLLWLEKDEARLTNCVELLTLLRWVAMDRTFVDKRLLNNGSLSADSVIRAFLDRVSNYLSGGSPFAGLITTHRQNTGIERCAFIVGFATADSFSTEILRVSLQRSDVSVRGRIPTRMNLEAAACICPWTNTIYVSGVGTDNEELWQWSGSGGWFRCKQLLSGRRRHAMIFTSERFLFFISGIVNPSIKPVSSVDYYDTRFKTCTTVGNLLHGVQSPACVAIKDIIYIIGGIDEHGGLVDHVQAYHSVHFTCSLFPKPMPRPEPFPHAVTWQNLVIVICFDTCFLLDVESQVWEERAQYKFGGIHCGCLVENGKMFVIGGDRDSTDPATGDITWKMSDEVRYVTVDDILSDRPAHWVRHSSLPEPCLVKACVALNAAARR